MFVACAQDSEMALTVAPNHVLHGITFTVSSPIGGGLPDKIKCIIRKVNELGTSIFQLNIINTTGIIGLDLSDTFGAFQVGGCNDLNCRQRTVHYSVELLNAGKDPMNITQLEVLSMMTMP